MLKKLCLILGLSLVSISFCLAVPCSGQVKAGDSAPDFEAVASDGQTYKLADLKGRTIVLEWTNHGCPYVKKHYSVNNMQDTQAQAVSNGVTWLSIVSSAKDKQGYTTAQQANKLMKKVGSKATARLLDSEGKLARCYGAKRTPEIFIINPEGKVVYAGAIDSDSSSDSAAIKSATNYVKQALLELAAGKKVSVPQTVAYGCSIKFK